MWVLTFYRFYISLLSGILFYFFIIKNLWFSILCTFIFRFVWFTIELVVDKCKVNKDFKKHIYQFKQQNGPYGIRIANKAENDWKIKASLSEVFTPNNNKLEKNVELLETMDALFSSGMRPEGDEFLLHDLKLKYGKFRLKKKV